jgi:hypothetical protein
MIKSPMIESLREGGEGGKGAEATWGEVLGVWKPQTVRAKALRSKQRRKPWLPGVLGARRLYSYARPWKASVAGAKMSVIPKDDDIDVSTNGTSANGNRPYLGLSDAARAEQQASLSELLDELIAEGADGSGYLPQLEAEAELEDAQAAASLESTSP